MGRQVTDKPDRLVQSAVKLFHRNGVQATSIADIARDSGVPLGNVFYYFRTKEALIRAVVDHWIARIDATLDSLVPDRTPKQRLIAFLELAAGRADVYAAQGCPIVSLVRDLRLSDDALAPLARKLASRQTEWISRMLEAMGVGSAAALSEAQSILAALQGSFQLAFALGESGVITASVVDLERRLDVQPKASSRPR